jgi:bifunctional oligoribonuclease and PAP phosphatase NrnA
VSQPQHAVTATVDAVEDDDPGVGGPPSRGEWSAAVAALHDLPPGARVLLICHVNPDGDALGSMLGFGLGLRRIASELSIGRLQATFPGEMDVPEPFRQLPGADLLIRDADADPAPDAALAFDAASIERLGKLGELFQAAPVSILLDHHASNTRFGGINLVDPHAAATSVLADGLLRRLGVPLDVEIAECLYVALATDTGSFKFDSTTPLVHEFAARLISTGLRTGELSRRLFDSRPFGAVRLFGEAMARATLEPDAVGGAGLVWTYATLEDVRKYGQRPAVLEALIDSVRCVQEADVACVIKQVTETQWAVSMRSKGRVDVSRVAVALGGGGHRFAAGFTGAGTATDIIESIRAELARAEHLP